ncbi:putative monooxygenase [Pleomassaria siparia CBS 279.74]|uniref:Putative monooxygenase n=1 Tax=Pleomassaria siparia CBS 279.74 TaxID=1314801 RepID=A0A6G1JU71_9PLEO|nr:putative monooxygenase [Pleomassaria siparia CBS 279.74]
MAFEKPIIIIGAGVVGLTLAHGLKRSNIPFQIYERDSSISSRGQGWAITIHWALPFIQEMLDAQTLANIDGVQVDPEVGRNDTGNFLFINLETLEPKFKIPPNERRRVNREKLRRVLLEDVKEHVHWSKRLSTIETETCAHGKGGVVAVFEDGTRVSSALIVGAEGSNSSTRKYLRPDAYRNTQLPVRFIGSAVDMTPAQAKPLRDLDPLLFQGCHPTSGTFLWVSMLESPAVNGTAGTEKERYRVQINVSWPVKVAEDEVKLSHVDRMAQMKSKAACFAPSLKAAVDMIPDDSEVLEIVLADWPCLDWNGRGVVTLVGDAAHAMTMYRGEAANHGLLDAYRLTKALTRVHNGELDQDAAIALYEDEMRERTSTAVLLSRQACLDAHDWDGLNENSAVLKRRAISSV